MPSSGSLNSRERWLSALRLEAVDRLPFWAKIDAAYAQRQPQLFARMPLPELHECLGSEPQVWMTPVVRDKRTHTEHRVNRSDGQRLTEYVTPGRTLRLVERFDQGSLSWHPAEFPLRSLEDVEVLTSWYEDLQIELNEAGVEKARAEAREASFCTTASIGVSPMMDYLQHLAGIDRGQYLLADYPQAIRALFDAMHAGLLRRAELICEHSPADLIYMVENTSTTLLSPDQFRRYCLPYLAEYARVAASFDRLMALHMCGHLKVLLPDLDTLPVAAFEAFTSAPVGNTALGDGRAACRRKCLIGGTNAALWTRPASVIIGALERDLERLPHHRGLILSSAGVMPPAASPETIQAVVEWIHDYPARW